MREKNKELYEKYWEKVKNLKPVIEYDEIYKDCHLLVVFNHMGFRCGYIGLNDLETSEDELDEILQFHYGITFDRTTEDILEEKTAMITKYVKPDYKRYVGFDAGHFTDKNDIITLAKHAGLSEAEIEYGKSIFPSDKKATVKSLNFMVNNLKQGVKNLEEHKNKK